MRIIPGNAQDIGRRKEQQDDFGFSDIENSNMVLHAGVLALLTDGMGGLSLGREAGQLAKITMLMEYEKKSNEETIPQALERSLVAANEAVLQLAQGEGLEGEIGTTLVAAVIKDYDLYWISVGDSHLYLFRDGRLHQLNADHNYAQRLAHMVAAGTINKDEAENHVDRKALTSYLGLAHLTEVDQNLKPFPLENGDRVLLCSDGLYGTLTEDEIASSLLKGPQEAAENLVEQVLAKQRHHQDNVTVAILACEDDHPCPGETYWAGIRENFIRVGAALLVLLCVAVMAWWGKKYLQSRGSASREAVPQAGIQKVEIKPPLKVEESARPPLVESKSQLLVEPQPVEPEKKSTSGSGKQRKKSVKKPKKTNVSSYPPG